MTGPGTGDGEGWDTGTVEEEDAIMAEAARLMKLWKVPADIRQFLSDCCRLGSGDGDGWENELAIRKWSFKLLKAAHADGSMFSGHWDYMAFTASLPVPMPAWLFEKAKKFECESVVMVDMEEYDRDVKEDVEEDEVKEGDVKKDGVKEGDVKKDGVKEDDVKEDEVKEDEVKEDNVKKDGVKEGDVKKDGVKEDGVKEDEVNEDDVKEDNVKKDGVKEDDLKKEEVKKDDMKEDEVEEDDFMKDGVKEDDVKEDDVKEDDVKEDRLKEVLKEEKLGEVAFPNSSWGSQLPPETPKTSKPTSTWRPWEKQKLLRWKKKRSPASEARSQRRLREWQQRRDLQLESHLLSKECYSTPLPPSRELKNVRLTERLEVSQEGELGSQAFTSNQWSGSQASPAFPSWLGSPSSPPTASTPWAGIQTFPTPPPWSGSQTYLTPPPWSGHKGNAHQDFWLSAGTQQNHTMLQQSSPGLVTPPSPIPSFSPPPPYQAGPVLGSTWGLLPALVTACPSCYAWGLLTPPNL